MIHEADVPGSASIHGMDVMPRTPSLAAPQNPRGILVSSFDPEWYITQMFPVVL